MERSLQKEYIRRIDKALTFVDNHLHETLTLESVAEVSHFSPFHFHRLFKAVTGEPLLAYINRRRIEKCAAVLMFSESVSITELALQYGFSSNSSFTRTFKNFYGVSPTAFRKQRPGRFSKIRQEDSKNGQAPQIFEKYICNIQEHLNWITMNANVEIKKLPELHFAAITQIGENGIEQTFDRLIKWGSAKGLMNTDTRLAMIFHDSFKVTAPEKIRFSISMLVDKPIKAEGEVGCLRIEAGQYIVGRYEIRLEEFEKSWSSLFIWMNENNYKMAEGRPFEIYHNDFRTHPEKKCIVDMHIPIQ